MFQDKFFSSRNPLLWTLALTDAKSPLQGCAQERESTIYANLELLATTEGQALPT